MISICGASGLVGREMCLFLDENNIPYIGTYNTNKIEKSNMFQIDFSDTKIVENFLDFHKLGGFSPKKCHNHNFYQKKLKNFINKKVII